MPSMANIVVKKFDGVTDITFDQLAASSGDGSWAQWRQDTGNSLSLPNGLRSSMKMLSRWNGPRTARIIEVEIRFPYALQDSTTTKWMSTDQVVFKFVGTFPQAIPAGTLSEASYQGFNLLGALLTRQCGASGYAPT